MNDQEYIEFKQMQEKIANLSDSIVQLTAHYDEKIAALEELVYKLESKSP